MKYYYGTERRGPYFEGWYLKHQGDEGELAVIPAFHQQKDGGRNASIQVITRKESRMFSFPAHAFQAWPDLFQVRVGDNWFSRDGVKLSLTAEDFSLEGELRYGPFAQLEEDIMGPFRHLPGMQCVHGVLSMGHRVDGMVSINGSTALFSNGLGYVETDRGRSFPREYLWTQCIWRDRQKVSLMLSVAHIPLPVGGFTGCICEIRFAGRAYRLATYHGVKVKRWSEQGAVLVQGPLRLAVDLVEQAARPLQAPTAGAMTRTIHESLCATVRYRFWDGDSLLFDHTDSRASFEYAGEEKKKGRRTGTS